MFKRRKILTVLVVFVFIQLAYSQEISQENDTGQYFDEQIIEIESLNKNQLFDKSMEWVAITYNSAQDVVQYTSKENGKIICKGNFPTNLFMKSGHIKHTLTLEFKEGRYRQTFSNFSYYSSGSGEIPFESKKLGFKKKIYKETNNNIKLSSMSLKSYLKSGKVNDDW